MQSNNQQLKLPPIANPFKVTNDNQMLLNSDSLSQSKQRDQKIWDKNTASCRNPLRRFDKVDIETPKDFNYNNKEKKVIETALEIIQNRKKNKDLVGKNQTIVDVLEQKKEMFLVTMTHGIIEKEIKNLKDQAEDRERALKQSNEILNQDIEDFEQFQQKQKSETKSIEERFEQQVKKRLIIEQEIKNKQITFNSLRAEKSKNEENISSYEKYKRFLNQLPPQQWINKQQTKKQQKLKALKQKKYQQWVAKQDSKQGQVKLRTDFESYFQRLKQSGENEEIEEILNNEEMYFKQPHELIEYFNNLQEANLFCIQNVQAADQKLQELLVKSEQHKKQLVAKYKSHEDQKKALEKQLAELENQIKALKRKKQQNNVLDGKDNKDIKSAISAQYQNMKEMMGTFLPEIENNAEALALLSGIEICMERLWQRLRECYSENPKGVKQLKNEYEKKKTAQKRQKATRTNNQQQMRRKEKNQQAKQPTNKIFGRADMKRSAPIEKAVKKKKEVKNKDINDDHQYLVQ